MAGYSGAVSGGRTHRLPEHELVLIIQHLDAFTVLTLELAARAAEPVITTIESVEPVVPVAIAVDAFFFGFSGLPGQHAVGLTVHAGQ